MIVPNICFDTKPAGLPARPKAQSKVNKAMASEKDDQYFGAAQSEQRQKSYQKPVELL